ncbi:MAG: DUF1049 domain-containing protein [Hyphomicrobiales bacterium]|nr:DUF1049 domain-containing protein [Hyphomicrobiales bacterium]
MIRKLVTILVLLPLAILLVTFAVANRQSVVVLFDPFNEAHPAHTVTLPLYVLSLILLVVGIVVGGVAAWLRQGKWRRAARQAEGEVRALRAEIARLERRSVPVELPSQTIDPAPRLTIAPPAA